MTSDHLMNVIDNDLLIKAAAYGIAPDEWPCESGHHRGVLGAARFVARARLQRMQLQRNDALQQLASCLHAVEELEPSAEELALAADIERAATELSLAVDGGEAQLAAIAVLRDVGSLATGDKRAIRGLELLLDQLPALQQLHGRVVCLEQLALVMLDRADDTDALALRVCAEPNVDKALNVSFACASAPRGDRSGLESYVQALRAAAPRVLS